MSPAPERSGGAAAIVGRGGALTFIVAAFVLGIAARVALLSIAPRWGFSGDHVDYVCWGRQAVSKGVLDLYRHPPGPCPADLFIDGRATRLGAGSNERLNYPALSAYVFALEGRLHRALDPEAVANTFTSRAVYAASTTLAELTTALGIFVLVGSFATAGVAALAFAATWLAPPLLIDGPFWGQTESWILAPAVWMLVAMTRGRWLAAGILWGVALALKPSGLIVAPLWLYAFLFRPARARIVLGGIAAVAVVNLLAVPFWLDSGDAWLRATFTENYVYRLQWTTAMAFNVWYADLLWTDVLDPRVPVLGLGRDAWGTLFLAIGLVGSFALARAWERRHAALATFGLVPAAALIMLAAVMLPTRVHSTYGAFTAPFLVATAALAPRATIGAAACAVTISLQILSWQWGNLLAMHRQGDESIFPPALRARRQELRAIDRPREWALTVANLAAASAVAIGVAASVRRPRA